MPTYDDVGPGAPAMKPLGVPADEFNPRISAFIAAQRAEGISRTQSEGGFSASTDGVAAQAVTYGLIYVGDQLGEIVKILETYLPGRSS